MVPGMSQYGMPKGNKRGKKVATIYLWASPRLGRCLLIVTRLIAFPPAMKGHRFTAVLTVLRRPPWLSGPPCPNCISLWRNQLSLVVAWLSPDIARL